MVNAERPAPLHARTVLQLAGLVGLAFLANLESPAFRALLVLAAVGSVVHALLPDRQRLAFFAAISVLSVPVVLGSAGWIVIAVGSVLLAACHLRVAYAVRVALLLAVGALLAIARTGRDPFGIPAIVWPVLASMLMFRLGLYLGAVRRGDVPTGTVPALAYAFMLPNAAFPLFPIVDYRTFVRSREARPTPATCERGLAWIARGMVHLLLYRIVYYDVAPREMLVYGLGDVVRHLLSAVLLYLRVSGTFHVITGILHLFGFRLPLTHHLYLLATGFADYWRRINTYWRDFLMRIVYYPVFLRLRRRTLLVRALSATVAVFAVTWLLHAWQYFWLNGRLLPTVQDATFWAAFAVLVCGATVRALRGPRTPEVPGWSARRGLSTLTTFAVISVLWSWWSASDGAAWLFLWSQARFAEPMDWLLLVSVITGVFMVGGSTWAVRPLRAATEPDGGSGAGRLALVGGLCILMVPAVQDRLPGRMQQYAEHMRGYGVIDNQDVVRLRGYYEDVIRGRPSSDTPVPPPAVEGDTPDLWLSRDDFLLSAFRPSVRGQVQGRPFTTNSAGWRDREYAIAKPEGTVRIAILGPSDVAGAGVGDDEVFEAIVEARLDSMARRSGRRVEILNFGVTAWSTVQRAMALREVVAPFRPDLVLLAVNPYEVFLLQLAISEAARRKIAVPDRELATILTGAGVRSDMDVQPMMRRLRVVEERLQHRTLAWAAEEAGAMGAQLATVTLSLPGVSWISGLSQLRRAATAAGVPVLECAGAFRWSNGNALALSAADPHPNAAGHGMIAECLFEQLTGTPALRPALGDLVRSAAAREDGR